MSRMTIVVDADDNTLEQVRKQLAKLVPVTDVHNFKGSAYIERDLALICVACGEENRGHVIQIAGLFRGKVVDVAKDSLVIELAGAEQKIEAFVELMKPYGIKELARTGVIAMGRGAPATKASSPSGQAKPRKRSIEGATGAALPPS